MPSLLVAERSWSSITQSPPIQCATLITYIPGTPRHENPRSARKPTEPHKSTRKLANDNRKLASTNEKNIPYKGIYRYYPKTEYLIIGSFGPLGFSQARHRIRDVGDTLSDVEATISLLVLVRLNLQGLLNLRRGSCRDELLPGRGDRLRAREDP